jgi:hypothetical protein
MSDFLPKFTERMVKERNCEPELVRAILTDFLAELHEVSFKQGLGPAMVMVYWEASALAAWHFGGLICKAAVQGEPGELAETYQRLDCTMERFRTIQDRWQYELDREHEQYELDHKNDASDIPEASK